MACYYYTLGYPQHPHSTQSIGGMVNVDAVEEGGAIGQTAGLASPKDLGLPGSWAVFGTRWPFSGSSHLPLPHSPEVTAVENLVSYEYTGLG